MRIIIYLIYSIILTSIFTLLVQYKSLDIFSYSPFVDIQQIGDPINDMKFIGTNCVISNSITDDHPSNSDISGITYFSDGKSLNSTMWLRKIDYTHFPTLGNQDRYPQLDIYTGNISTLRFTNFTKDFVQDFFSKIMFYNNFSFKTALDFSNKNFKAIEINFTPTWQYMNPPHHAAPNGTVLFLSDKEKFIAFVYEFPDDIWVELPAPNDELLNSYQPFHESVMKLFDYTKNHLSNLKDYPELIYAKPIGNEITLLDKSLIYDNKEFNYSIILPQLVQNKPTIIHKIMFFPTVYEDFLPTKHFMIIDINSQYDKGIDYIITQERRIKLYDYFIGRYGIPITEDPYQRDLDTENITINSEIKRLGQYGILDNFLTKNISISEQKDDPAFKGYVNLNFDLGIANHPSQYKLIFGKIIDPPYTDCSLVDLTNWVTIPSPEFNVTLSPNSIDLRPNEKKEFQLNIKSLTNLYSNVSINSPINKKLIISPEIDNSFIPPFGNAIANIEVEQRKNNSEYTTDIIPINLLINFPGETLVKIGSKNISTTSTDSVIISKNFVYNVRLLSDYNFSEYLEMASKYASSLSNITGFLIGIIPFIVTIIFRKYKKSEN